MYPYCWNEFSRKKKYILLLIFAVFHLRLFFASFFFESCFCREKQSEKMHRKQNEKTLFTITNCKNYWRHWVVSTYNMLLRKYHTKKSLFLLIFTKCFKMSFANGRDIMHSIYIANFFHYILSHFFNLS